ncbi:MAG TPA: hypothetical protein VGI93_23520 [Steroidobacteraceae bacterium]|jgi:hypothetical protein
MRKLAALSSITLFSMVFAGCASQHDTYAPDGRRGFAVTCGGLLNSWSNCLVKAGRACGNRGYDVIRGTEEDRAMLVACRLPNAAAPTSSNASHE